MRAIDRKVLRDLVQLRAQLIAIALVLAAGLGLFLSMGAMLRSLESARSHYYAQERFAHVFASLRRAPERVAHALREIPGVQRLQTRVVARVTLDVPGMAEAVAGRLISVPERGRSEVNGIRLRAGRRPEIGRRGEVLLNEVFAQAHGLEPGDTLSAVLNGRWQSLRVVGLALSPEYTISLAPGMLIPDDRRFGVLWMHREGLAAAFDLEGAFNDVGLQIGPGTSRAAVIERVDALLAPYGGAGAYGREDQISAFYIENEIAQVRSFGTLLPIIFLGVAAFLIHIVVGRLVASQREQIAALKALGYRDRDVGAHYAKLVGAVIALGSLIGLLLAGWMGSGLAALYLEYYRFPELPFEMGLGEALQAMAIGAAAAVLGAGGAIRRTVRMPPAEAMRPEAPHQYRRTLVERLGLHHWLPGTARIVLREVERRPMRAGLSLLGIALAAAIMVLSTFSLGAMQYMMNAQFGLSQRADVELALFEPRALSALSSIEQLPGVMHAEPFRGAPVRLRAGPRSERTEILGLPAGVTLHAVLDERDRPIEIPPAGVVLSRKLAELLGLRAGDDVRIEVLEGARSVRVARVARVAETFVGTTAYMDLEALCALLGETPSLSGTWLSVDDDALPALHRAVKHTPAVAGITSRDAALGNLKKLLDENLGTSVTISTGFSLVLALGVLFNAARITLAERARDLASLRVLGFRRSEVSAILLGELALLTAVALPLGLAIGHALVALMVNSPGFDSDQFRIPNVITSATDAGAVFTVLVAAAISGWSAWRRLDRMDIAAVLKTRD